jgi:hypothetical protein
VAVKAFVFIAIDDWYTYGGKSFNLPVCDFICKFHITIVRCDQNLCIFTPNACASKV